MAKDYNSKKSNTSGPVWGTTNPKTQGLIAKESKLNKHNNSQIADSDVNGSVNGNRLLKLNQNNSQAPKPGMQRMLFNRLVNANAIPGVSPRIGIGTTGGPADTPAFTSEIELTTQAGAVLTTQAGADLIMQ